MRFLVTGGAGLVGSCLCAKLLQRGSEVVCADNLSMGSLRHIAELLRHPRLRFRRLDVSRRGWYRIFQRGSFDALVHLAGNSDISLGGRKPLLDFRRTLTTTIECLMAAKDLEIPRFLFSSSSAIYGAKAHLPTPELSAGMHPVSIYGAGKLASEAYISAFVENYGLNAWVFRFGNVVGRKLTHGVIFDFVRKLRADPARLDVLGDGRQTKTYIDVGDCVDGMLLALRKSAPGRAHAERFQVFNLSARGTCSVRFIAEAAVRAAVGGGARIVYGRSPVGWVGDVARTALDVRRIWALGWRPRLSSREAVLQAIREHEAWTRSGRTPC